ncbi:MAG: preprotein translocase subunit SecY [Candidatus Altiarchaeota archaeon]|nr:preprotein translocase subunit SecY [Candidatus Altiarchaeota archaeon]
MLQLISKYIPEVREPIKRLSFNDRLKWTVVVLVLYFILGNIPIYGLSAQSVDYFQNLRAIIAGNFGSIVTLGIGPIVTSGIILQLLVGSDFLSIDMNTPQGKKRYEMIEKVLVIAVTIFESFIYVFMGGLPPEIATFSWRMLIVFQLCLGTFILILLDQISSKWGFVSGISLFIAAGVSATVVTSIFNPLANPDNPIVPSGKLWAAIHYIAQGDPSAAFSIMLPVLFTLLVFLAVVYTQSIKVEIPLAFARVRGAVTRWPLNLFYTSNIPVIFTAALIANLELFSRFMAGRGIGLFGQFDQTGSPVGGLIMYFIPPRDLVYFLIFNPLGFLKGILLGGAYRDLLLRAIGYTIAMVFGSVMFARFWVYTSNMDSGSVAKNIQQSGMGIPGFRRDPRILKKVLDRYIPYLTDLGAIAIGLLAAFADFTNSVARGTGILLAVMILFRMYEDIVGKYMMDMNPTLRRFVSEK